MKSLFRGYFYNFKSLTLINTYQYILFLIQCSYGKILQLLTKFKIRFPERITAANCMDMQLLGAWGPAIRQVLLTTQGETMGRTLELPLKWKISKQRRGSPTNHYWLKEIGGKEKKKEEKRETTSSMFTFSFCDLVLNVLWL